MSKFVYGAPHPPSGIDESIVQTAEDLVELLTAAIKVARGHPGHPGQVEARIALRGLLRARNDLEPVRAFVRYSKERNVGY